MGDNDTITITKADLKDLVNGILTEYKAQEEAAQRPTKDEIMAIKDPIQRQQAIRENLDLFRRN